MEFKMNVSQQIPAPNNYSEERNRYSVLLPLCAAGIIIPIVFTGPAIATPMIALELGGSSIELGGIVNAYNVAFGSCVMAGGTLADRFGRKRCFLSGLILFFITSLLIGFAPDIISLNILRGIEGIAGALTLTSSSALIAQEFDEHLRLRAFSFLGTSFGIGLAFGPMLVGTMIANFGWRSLFFFIALVSLLVLLFSAKKVNESKDPEAKSIDWPGIILFTLALSTLTLGIVFAPERGWTDIYIIGLFLTSALLLVVFVIAEVKSRYAMLDLSLFRYPRFIGVQLLPISTGFCFVALLVSLPIWFIGIQGFNEGRVGLAILPLTAPMLVVPFIAGYLSKYVSPGLICSIGLLVAAVGGCWLAFSLQVDGNINSLVGPLLMIGIGSGLPWGLMDGLSMSVVPKERAGMAAGIFTTMRVSGEALAIAIIGALLAAKTSAILVSAKADHAFSNIVSSEWGGKIASGQMSSILESVTDADRASLGHWLATIYQNSFGSILLIIAALTALSALACALLLRREKQNSIR
ncbi:major facilitator superfamily mfs_1 precursor [Photorhabdus asymbiotica]|uniref:Major facilitator superfamily mfs_1 n=2 Tax=Photorhabdus asymbiotica TaxID=291112 RepID=B6VKZ5_PHOAA|nr:major facilitator superfamily mfs_1 precursor [Photorhabdus asymbiotica]CAR66825.1 major facilitator superfamily mfs_1 precursor [Photorhabdus asymbiotica subsp. asymbiotica ATCC 43949]